MEKKTYSNAVDLFQNEYISYSRISSYEQCPYLFKLKYLEKCPSTSSRAAELGKTVHAVIASYLNTINNSTNTQKVELSHLCDEIEPTCDMLLDTGETNYEFDTYEIKPLLEGFVNFMPYVNPNEIHGIEEEKNFHLRSLKYKCILDLILKDSSGNFTVIDFKTGKPKYVEDKQIKLYSMSLFKDFSPSSIKLIYAFLRFYTTEEYDFSFQESQVYEDIIHRKVCRIMEDDTFYPRTSFLCRYCDVRDYCDHG